MFDQFDIGPTIAVSDLARARQWYDEVLGLTPTVEVEETVIYPAGGRPMGFSVYRSPNAGTNRATYAAWMVDDLDAVMSTLRDRGVEFHEYATREVVTHHGVATDDAGNRSAWFSDPDGNVLSLVQFGG